MTAAFIVAAAAGIGLGAWLRWAVRPVLAAYRAGRAVGRAQGRRQP